MRKNGPYQKVLYIDRSWRLDSKSSDQERGLCLSSTKNMSSLEITTEDSAISKYEKEFILRTQPTTQSICKHLANSLK